MRQHRKIIQKGTFILKRGLAQMQKGGVIMDVVTAEQAKIAQAAGACAVMALERVPADIRRQGGVARMADPKIIREIIKAVSIPVMAKVRIGHYAEAQILEALGVDFIDESEVLTPADEEFHIDKHKFKVPFVCGARDLGEALRRIHEGAAMIRTKGEAGTGNIVEAVRHMRKIQSQLEEIHEIFMKSGKKTALSAIHENLMKRQKANKGSKISQTFSASKSSVNENLMKKLQEKADEYRVPVELVFQAAKDKKLPVPNFAAGGIATPADAALMMQMAAEGVFVGSGIFKSENPEKYAKAIVDATLHFENPEILAKVSSGLGSAMESFEISKLENLYAKRGI